MNHFTVTKIPVETRFSKTVFLDDQFLLTTPEMPFSQGLKTALANWAFPEILSEGEPRDGDDVQAAAGDIAQDEIKLKDAETFYASFLQYAELLFSYATKKEPLEFTKVAEKITEVCDYIKEDHRFLLRVIMAADKNTGGNYLAAHAVNSAISSIIIGVYFKIPLDRLIELGVAALLHEIGMTGLPPEVYLNNRPLTPPEQKAILTHPVLGYSILKAADFPLTVSIAVLEHHERENGSGYPRKLPGNKISLYAKIIAVACSYEALTTSRPYRDAKDGFTGMLDLLKNEGKQYDDRVIRALVYSFSIYPIGLYVLLSDGKKGQVVDVNPENPRFPVVQILGEPRADGKTRTLQTSSGGVSINRPLLQEEITVSQ
ncbi:phosphohydrolase [Spirochaetia bacterium]|nr:phosphohydrolase [Spirochaetia bacterium]